MDNPNNYRHRFSSTCFARVHSATLIHQLNLITVEQHLFLPCRTRLLQPLPSEFHASRAQPEQHHNYLTFVGNQSITAPILSAAGDKVHSDRNRVQNYPRSTHSMICPQRDRIAPGRSHNLIATVRTGESMKLCCLLLAASA